MNIKEIKIDSWRNLKNATLTIPPGITVISGKNGEGKSNLLEAIFSLVNFRSFRTNSLSEAIQWGRKRAEILGKLEVAGSRRELEFAIEKTSKSSYLDGKSVRRDSDFLNPFCVVVFSPEDLKLVKAAPVERRKFLDRIVFSGRRNYARVAIDYHRSIKARNNLLRIGKICPLLKSYDEILSRSGAQIIQERRDVVSKLQKCGSGAFCDLHSTLEFTVSYKTKLGEVVEEGREADFIYSALGSSLKKDIERGFTSVGPHHDDLRISLKGLAADQHASQGQIRSIVLALKIAELEIVKDKIQENPLFLLDDVASELDKEKRTKMLDVVKKLGCQSMLSVTENDQVPQSDSRTDWTAKNGEIFTS